MEITLKSLRTIFTKSKTNDQSVTTSESRNGTTTPLANSLSSDVQVTQIDGTPFVLVGNKQHDYFIALGSYRLTTKLYKTSKQALQDLEYGHWEIACNMMAIMIEHWNELKESALKRPDDGKK